MLSCGCFCNHRKEFPTGTLSSHISSPNEKFLCKNTTAVPEHIKVGVTALNFSTEIISADRTVMTNWWPQTEVLYPENNYYIKQSNMHVPTANTASSDTWNIKTGQAEFYNMYIQWPHWVVYLKQARLSASLSHYINATMTQLFHLPVSHINHGNEFNRNTCIFWANFKCKYSQHQSTTRVLNYYTSSWKYLNNT